MTRVVNLERDSGVVCMQIRLLTEGFQFCRRKTGNFRSVAIFLLTVFQATIVSSTPARDITSVEYPVARAASTRVANVTKCGNCVPEDISDDSLDMSSLSPLFTLYRIHACVSPLV